MIIGIVPRYRTGVAIVNDGAVVAMKTLFGKNQPQKIREIVLQYKPHRGVVRMPYYPKSFYLKSPEELDVLTPGQRITVKYLHAYERRMNAAVLVLKSAGVQYMLAPCRYRQNWKIGDWVRTFDFEGDNMPGRESRIACVLAYLYENLHDWNLKPIKKGEGALLQRGINPHA